MFKDTRKTDVKLMTCPAFLKRLSTYVILLAVFLVIGIFIWRSTVGSGSPYETFEALRTDLIKTVEVTGKIMPSARISLAFELGGTVRAINVKVGDSVQAGDVLA